MKKWGFILLVCIILAILAVASQFHMPETGVDIKELSSEQKERKNSDEIQKIVIEKNQIYEGNLILINNEHAAHKKSIKKDIVSLVENEELINGYTVLNNEIYLSEDIANKFSEMVRDANKEGISNFIVTSGYRDFEKQDALYREMGSDYALPAGYSEHNSGLSLDIGSTQMKIVDSPEGEWIEENSWKYGFILRYPKDKTDITGIQYEPWHIRYVGLPHSAIMKEKNLVLEEYLEYLKKEKRLSVTINDKKYKINYYNVSDSKTVHIPKNSEYEISGDNMDGVIVTIVTKTNQLI